MSKLQLTISLLVSKRPDTIRKCLDSLQPLLAAIPSELILTDTGCGQEVRSIIEQYDAKILEFEWCKDFSKARNLGLKSATGEWFMFLDDDEWFEDTTEIIDFFKSGEYKKYGMATYNQRNYSDMKATTYADLAVGRMIRLDPGVEFMYSIHEVFNCVPGKVKKLNDYVHHYGYVYANEEARLAHSRRNITLLLKEHAKTPGNHKHTMQLIREYCAVREWQKSWDLSLEGIELYKGTWNGQSDIIAEGMKLINEDGEANFFDIPSDSETLDKLNSYWGNHIYSGKKVPTEHDFCVPSFWVNLIDMCPQLDKEDEMIPLGEKYIAEEKLDPLAVACIQAQLVAAALRQGEKVEKNQASTTDIPTQASTVTNENIDNNASTKSADQYYQIALDYIEKYWTAYEKELKQDDYYIEYLTTITSDCFAIRSRNIVLCNALVVAAKLKDIKSCKSLWSRIDKTGSKLVVNSGFVEYVLKNLVSDHLASAPTAQAWLDFANDLLLEEEMTKFFRSYIENQLDVDTSAPTGNIDSALSNSSKENIASIFSKLTLTDWYGHMLKVIATSDLSSYKKVWENISESLPYLVHHRLWTYISEVTDVTELLSNTKIQTWRTIASSFCQEEKWEEVESFNDYFNPSQSTWYQLIWQEVYNYCKLLREECQQDSLITLSEFAFAVKEQTTRLYKEDIIEYATDLLPVQNQAALLIANVFPPSDEGIGMDTTTCKQLLKVLKTVVSLMPELGDAIKACTNEITDLLNKALEKEEIERSQAKSEMDILADNIMVKATELIEAGDTATARQILMQVSAMMPENKKVLAMLDQL